MPPFSLGCCSTIEQVKSSTERAELWIGFGCGYERGEDPMVGEELSKVIQTNYVALLAWQRIPIRTALSYTKSHNF
jgi:hypothetical protein